MAKFEKSNREILDVNKELQKVTKDKNVSKKSETKKSTTAKKSKVKKDKKGVFGFFHDVKSEISKVKWPSKKEMGKYIGATISFILFFSVFFYILIVLMAWLKEII